MKTSIFAFANAIKAPPLLHSALISVIGADAYNDMETVLNQQIIDDAALAIRKIAEEKQSKVKVGEDTEDLFGVAHTQEITQEKWMDIASQEMAANDSLRTIMIASGLTTPRSWID